MRRLMMRGNSKPRTSLRGARRRMHARIAPPSFRDASAAAYSRRSATPAVTTAYACRACYSGAIGGDFRTFAGAPSSEHCPSD